jgi:hypothetical protein
MGISLTGLTPATTYDALIKVGDNGPIDATLKVLSDGLGTNLPMEASTTGINFTGNLTQSGTALQPVLVSGTNIKTINSTSILGSGNIAVVTSPSGVAGAIQFSNGSAFASDAANLFWDDTNNRLGIGTNAPSALLNVENSTNGVLLARFKDNINANTYLDIKTDSTLTDYTALYFGSSRKISSKQGGPLFLNCDNNISFVDGGFSVAAITPSEVQIGSISGARLGIKGSGSTSATTSLLVQNSSGTSLFSVRDDGVATFSSAIFGGSFTGTISTGFLNSSGNAFTVMRTNNSTGNATFDYSVAIGTTSAPVASAGLEVVSTTKGFLPPRMTTTQINAIASPAAGLVVYDNTTNKLQCYNGSTWNDLF